MAEYRRAEKSLEEALDIFLRMEQEHGNMTERLRSGRKDRLGAALLRQMEAEQEKLSALSGMIAGQLEKTGENKRKVYAEEQECE